MTQNPPIPCTGPAVTSLATARVGMRPPGSRAMLALGGLVLPDADGFVLPIALVAVAAIILVAGAIVVAIARRRLSRGPSADAGESDGARAGTLEALAGRDRNLPRWLDPSVAAARFRTDTTTAVRATRTVTPAPARVPVVFADAGDDLVDRMLVRYDGVPLLDRPDDVLGRTLAEMDGGDEVEVVERAEIWARVRTPNGASGWLPTMTLVALLAGVVGPDVDATDPDDPEPAPAEEAPPPLEAILEAIVAQRRIHPGGIADSVPTVVAVGAAAEPPKAKRTRTFKPRADRAADPRVMPQTSTDPIDPGPTSDIVGVAGGAKRSRTRAAAGERRPTRPR